MFSKVAIFSQQEKYRPSQNEKLNVYTMDS